jgi:hypothetical protein
MNWIQCNNKIPLVNDIFCCARAKNRGIAGLTSLNEDCSKYTQRCCIKNESIQRSKSNSMLHVVLVFLQMLDPVAMII